MGVWEDCNWLCADHNSYFPEISFFKIPSSHYFSMYHYLFFLYIRICDPLSLSSEGKPLEFF